MNCTLEETLICEICQREYKLSEVPFVEVVINNQVGKAHQLTIGEKTRRLCPKCFVAVMYAGAKYFGKDYEIVSVFDP